jgi:hypothetical protein
MAAHLFFFTFAVSFSVTSGGSYNSCQETLTITNITTQDISERGVLVPKAVSISTF